jgi:hypothetical protein
MPQSDFPNFRKAKLFVQWRYQAATVGPEIIFAISEDPALDQKELPLVEALN